MPILENTEGILKCPNCGASSIDGYRIERRITVKAGTDIRQAGIGSDYLVCVQCGKAVKRVK